MWDCQVFRVWCILAIFGTSCCRMAPATGSASTLSEPFPVGAGAKGYALQTTVLLNEAGARGRDVGYMITAEVNLAAIWGLNNERLIQIELVAPKLHIKSRKAPAPEGFIEHSSKLEVLVNKPFYISWNAGMISDIYVDKEEGLSMVNLKKGIASLFQYQLLDGEVREKDTSGDCATIYTSSSPTSIRKSKKSCVSSDQPFVKKADDIFSALTISSRETVYTFGQNSEIMKIVAEETHEMEVALKRDAGNNVKTLIELTSNGKTSKFTTISGNSLEQAVLNLGHKLKQQSLLSEREPQCQDDACPTLAKLVRENKVALSSDYLGSSKSASAFLRVISALRTARKEDIVKAFGSKGNKDILPQLCDLAGFAQTTESHEGIKKLIHLDSEYDFELSERYLYALSMASQPQESVIEDVLKLSDKEHPNEKLSETLILTVAAMTSKFSKLPGNSVNKKVVAKVTNAITHNLSKCAKEDCKLRYLRALKNLNNPNTIPKLLTHATKGSKTVSVSALKAIKSLPKEYWDEKVIKTCRQIFLQLIKKYDSSPRTVALDIILESEPSFDVLHELIHYLKSDDKTYEVKQYLLQRLRMISEADESFRMNVERIIQSDSGLNNYAVLGQKGLTTAFSRYFMKSAHSNGSLVTIQEIQGGILKQGVVNIVLEGAGVQSTVFSLGIFAGGLGSFVGDGTEDTNEKEAPEEEEVATAGMEFAFQGVGIRPFVFFTGQGELMGHVWSGTASEKTPAYQAIQLLHDHQEFIRLQTGGIAELSLLGASSLDLSGQIQLSLWSRNAHSLVEKNTGISLQGLLKVDSSFVRSQSEFTLTAEPKVLVTTDIDFYSKIALCMQLSHPQTVIRHNIFKIERIPGSKHRLRKSTYKVQRVPGRSYLLNQKNNDMCNRIFQS